MNQYSSTPEAGERPAHYSPAMLLGQPDHSPISDVHDPELAMEPSDDHAPPPPPPLCSVLNTVVDFCMQPPTEQFEPDEYADSSSIEVPVLRFFGPIARRLSHDLELLPTHVPPQQSACLYVHGAFPYLVARPRRAGPDGSGTGQSPWDSAAAVQRMVPALTTTLEAALQETNASFATNSSNNNNTVTKASRVVRKITVVTGRGFYTYCQGPAAPFLRVEYYCPADRWKVKRCLERGLADLPRAVYHPLQPPHNCNAQDDDADDDLLRFNCYEAHIPYTMQFFKDWNLAGMSYIHVASTPAASVQFRNPLPSSIRQRSKPHAVDLATQSELSPRSAFLASNTPIEYLWRSGDKAAGAADSRYFVNETNELDGSDDEHRKPPADRNNLTAALNAESRSAVPKKVSSCDVELDISVSSILNVLDVLTDHPKDWEARQKVHWRAVPSLREIWSQERRRMAKLLQPQDDFLSGTERNESPPFTLDVKSAAPLPGAKLAREGMQKLLRVTSGLEESFRRAMRQIVERHAESVDRTDLVLRQRSAMARDTNMSDAAERYVAKDDGEAVAGVTTLTPSYDEAIEALGALGSLFKDSSPSIVQVGRASSWHQENVYSQREAPVGLDCDQDTRSPDIAAPPRELSSQSCGQELLMTLSQACSMNSLENGKESLLNEYNLSQRVERGDGIVDSHFESIDDVIDPTTLAPYESFDDDGDDDSDDDNEGRMERLLSTLATQAFMSNAKESGDSTPSDDDCSSTDAILLLTGRSVRNSDGLDRSDDGGPLVDIACVRSPGVSNSPASLKEAPTQLKSYECWHHPPDISIECLEMPPTRKEVLAPAVATGLYPMPAPRNLPHWTSHMAEYAALRVDTGREEAWFPPLGLYGVDVLPVGSAPTRKAVASWNCKRSKRQKPPEANRTSEVKRRRTSRGGKGPNACLHVDGKSRKFVAETIERTMPEYFAIEQVDWKSSQKSILSATQESEGSTSIANVPKEPKDTSQSTRESDGQARSESTEPTHSSITPFELKSPDRALNGIGNQGGRMLIEGGGQLKTKTEHSQLNATGRVEKSGGSSDSIPCPVTIMAIEVYVQCRTGRAGINDSKSIALTPDSSRDAICSVVYVLSRDPGGGEAFEFLERGCIFVPVGREIEPTTTDNSPNLDHFVDSIRKSMPSSTLGVSPPFSIECVRDERQLLLRLASIVRWKDPDMLFSWDTQGFGLGFLIERGISLGKDGSESGSLKELDMARLLGRTPTVSAKAESSRLVGIFESDDAAGAVLGEMNQSASNGTKEISTPHHRWKGSGLGTEWDERVGAGAAAASIVSISMVSMNSLLRHVAVSNHILFNAVLCQCGRLVFSAWKIISEEVKHPNFSYLPAVVASVLDKRIPFHENLKLAQWYGHDRGRERWRVLHHMLTQAVACLQLFDALDIVGRSGEAARLSGVEFSQSFPGIRGSQYKVEGVLLRALQSLNSDERGSKRGRQRQSQSSMGNEDLSAESNSQTQSPWKARRNVATEVAANDTGASAVHQLSDRSYFFFSPSLLDTTQQEALEVQALTLEPLSGHQRDPVVVCDFTALYPSLVIAYNLCYSTCAGKLDYHSTRNEMRIDGRTTGKVGPMQYAEGVTASVLKHHMKSLVSGKPQDMDRAYSTPTGAIFVSETVVKGVLPQVLDEILCTRAMLKKAAKQYQKHVKDLSPSVLRQLEARQLALKYVANVTYGKLMLPFPI